MVRAEITLISLPLPRSVKLIVKRSPGVRAAKSMQPHLKNAVASIFNYQQRIIEEYLLGFRLADIMLFDATAAIAFVPVKSFDPCEIDHCVYYHHIRSRQEVRCCNLERQP